MLMQFEREFEKAIMQIHRGKHSGKVDQKDESPYVVEGSHQTKFQNKQYEELYSVAMYSASERTRSLRRANQKDDEGFFDDWQKIVLTSLASILITSVICIMIFCCIRKSRKGRTVVDPSSESDIEVPRRG